MSKKLQQSGFAAILFVIAAGLLLVMILTRQNNPSAIQPVATGDPTLIASLTQIPQATPLSGTEAQKWYDLQARVDLCVDYSAQKRLQMERYIDWVINPATLPTDLLMIFGANPEVGLVRAMAMDTSTEWRLKKRPTESCLIEIGRTLNELLVGTGQEPLTIYDE